MFVVQRACALRLVDAGIVDQQSEVAMPFADFGEGLPDRSVVGDVAGIRVCCQPFTAKTRRYCLHSIRLAVDQG